MISLVSTVLNDIEGLKVFFTQMEAQTRQPDEIVITDAGSTDGSWELLQDYALTGSILLRCHQELGCNVARGRNLAIALTHHDLIASTDIGCSWDPEWLEELTEPLVQNPQTQAVMGSWDVPWDTLESDWAKVDYCLNRGLRFIATPKAHASSRAIAYRKQLWENIGGYPEDLTLAGDDMVFALLLHNTTDQIACAPIPRCHWQRPVTLRSFLKESRRNFRGGGEAGIWLDYGLLTGGRLLFDGLFSIGLFLLLLPHFKGMAVLLMVAASLSFILRMWRLLPAVKHFREQGGSGSWLKILIFEYLIKVSGVLGYWKGFLMGFNRCHQCRERLRQVKALESAQVI
ncbi:glycosyltransferase [Leptolyngbya sp. FACHB-16]|uniref:glycosyltransferase n=1 Tax=unclassified Leptolyngbya TaxID=2650499 RepID=UPI001683A68F|nr:glycosyltransferase [Leptolyngbya sp. FACHB-16]MBD2156183.1 glycosyltransferase [Leptolyngbya sp. FACHB-16]